MGLNKDIVRGALLIFGISFILLLIEVLVIPSRRFKTESGIKAQIEERLPLGSSVAQVKAFLDSENIERDEQPDERGLLSASVQDTVFFHPGHSVIVISFAFSDGKLERYSVEERVFGLP